MRRTRPSLYICAHRTHHSIGLILTNWVTVGTPNEPPTCSSIGESLQTQSALQYLLWLLTSTYIAVHITVNLHYSFTFLILCYLHINLHTTVRPLPELTSQHSSISTLLSTRILLTSVSVHLPLSPPLSTFHSKLSCLRITTLQNKLIHFNHYLICCSRQ